MSDRERMYQLLDNVPDNLIAYIIGYIQGITTGRDIPNQETTAAFEEGDAMLRDGLGQRYTDMDKLFRDLGE